MSLRHDLLARLLQRSRPDYGRSLYFAGADLAGPIPRTFATSRGSVRSRVYPGSGKATYLHLHGGAFITRFPEMDDFWARFVVATTGLDVVLPDYDTAPQVRYPVAHEQVADITRTLAVDGPLLVGGFSSGGNLVAAAALRAAADGFELRGQLMAVPSLDVAEAPETKLTRSGPAMIDRRLLTLVRATYFRDAARRGEPSASPLLAPELGGVSPALIVTAERDVLRPEGDAYARRLAGAGIEVEHLVVPGVDHYFLHGAGRAQARDIMTRMANWLATTAFEQTLGNRATGN